MAASPSLQQERPCTVSLVSYRAQFVFSIKVKYVTVIYLHSENNTGIKPHTHCFIETLFEMLHT
jgi:hypothetical protein